MAKKTTKKKKAVEKKKVKKSSVRSHSIHSAAGQSSEGAPQDPGKLNVTPHPTAGPKVVDFEKKLDAQIDAGKESKSKRGRPRKVVEPEPEASPEFIKGALKLPFELWSIGQGVEGLALTDVEAKQLAEPVKQLLDYYLPKIPAIAYAWCSCAVSVFWIMRPRMLLIQELKKQSSPSSEKGGTESEDGQGRPRPSSPPAGGQGGKIVFPEKTEPQQL